jgi:hypothetical protein
MIALDAHTKVYLARAHTDMRCQIDGLAARVEDMLQADPLYASGQPLVRGLTRDVAQATSSTVSLPDVN